MAESHFLALLSRMKYIERWALMRSSRPENLSEHSLEVALIAHMLCVIGNVRFGRHLDAERAALVALYHDASEIITGDMPTPVKYHDGDIRNAYKAVEKNAEQRLLDALPNDLRPAFEDVFWSGDDASDDELYLPGVPFAILISPEGKVIDRGFYNEIEDTLKATLEQLP